MTLAEAPRVAILPDPQRSPIALDGPLESEQSALVRMPPEQLDALWHSEVLERLARAYWQHLNRLSRGTLRVKYGESSQSVMLLGRIELLRFRSPRIETDPGRGRVSWPIDKGLLVARRGRGQGELAIEVNRRGPGEALVSARVSNFYPWLRGSGVFARLGRLVYAQTQLRIHVFVTKGFLRSLRRFEMPGA
jgi:hypothetical protein